MFAVGGLLRVDCCWRWVLRVGCCLLVVSCCMLFVVLCLSLRHTCCLLPAVCASWCCVRMLCAVDCCLLFAVCYSVLLEIADYLLSVAQLLVFVARNLLLATLGYSLFEVLFVLCCLVFVFALHYSEVFAALCRVLIVA